MGEDAIQSIPLFLNAEKIVYIQDPLYNYRMNEDSATNDFNTRHIVDINTVNELKVKLAKQLHRSDLINIVSKNYINVISKQIMLASVSDMSKSEKIRYLQDIHSRVYTSILNSIINRQSCSFLSD
ncbi:hypothetical protein [Aerococcus urinaeequi]|uniref:hypothetical protein n=1 Tax=Aerococcus urinaeequi TaxID=51665 RepID=UPI003D6A5443